MDAALYGAGVNNRALREDAELHAAVLGVHHGPQSRTRLMAVARKGNVPRLNWLLRMPSGALRGLTNVNGGDRDGCTALQPREVGSRPSTRNLSPD